MVKTRLLLLLGLMSTVFTPLLGAQETRRLLLFFEPSPEANFSPEEELLLYESLLVRLGTASRKVAVMEYPGKPAGGTDADRTVLARSSGADSWIRIELSGDWIATGVQVSSYDLIAQTMAFQFGLTKRLLRGAVDLERDFWKEVTDSVAGYYSQAAANIAVSGQVVFQTMPGTLISGAGEQRLKADGAGTASAAIQVPLTLSIRAVRPGFYPLEGKYYLIKESTTIPLELKRAARLAFEAYLNNMIFPGLAFSYFIIPGTLYLRAGATTFLGGILLTDQRDESAEGSLFVSRTLNHADLGLGLYLNDADRDLRAYAGIAAFLRFITSSAYFGLEPIAPWGLQWALGFEYSRSLKHRFYMEFAPLLYWTNSPELILFSFPRNYSVAGYAFLSKVVIDFLNLRLGYRLQI